MGCELCSLLRGCYNYGSPAAGAARRGKAHVEREGDAHHAVLAGAASAAWGSELCQGAVRVLGCVYSHLHADGQSLSDSLPLSHLASKTHPPTPSCLIH